MSWLLLMLTCVDLVFGKRCLPLKYVTNGAKCGDNTRVVGRYCGVGRCNIVGAFCKGGCRNAYKLASLERGDIVMCTRKPGAWKGSLALNKTHVVYPVFDRGFTRVVQDFRAATRSHLGPYCRVETSLFDHYADLLGLKSPSKDQEFHLHVRIFSQIWEYHVTSWKYGVGFHPAELVTEVFGEFTEEKERDEIERMRNHNK